MKILFVTDLCPTREDEKGLPLTLFNFIQDFIKLGHEVTLLRPNVTPNILLRGRKIYPEGEFLWQGIKIINKNFLIPFFNSKQFEFLKGKQFDIILSHMPSGILAAEKISTLLKTPYCAAVHSSDIKVLKDFKYTFLRKVMKKAYMSANLILPRSHWLLDEITKIVPDIQNKVKLIPSGIEKEVLINEEKIKEKAEKFYGNPYQILSVGSLQKRKNFSSLITAVSRIKNAYLKIAGEGSQKEYLKKLVKKLKIQDRVEFLGQKTKKEIYELMEENPLFILPSINETFGMVYLEAMAKGSIVICSKNSGMAGFIEDEKNGFLTDADKEGIYNTLIKAGSVINAEEIMTRALSTARKMDRIDMAQNYVNLIQNILV